MTKRERLENAQIKVKALERIMSKPLSYKESIHFGNELAQADAKVRQIRESMLSKRQKRIDVILTKGGIQ